MLLQAAVPKKTRSTAAPLHPSTPRPNIRCRASSQDPTVLLTNGLHRPIDCLLNAKATIHSMQLMLNAATQCEDRVLGEQQCSHQHSLQLAICVLLYCAAAPSQHAWIDPHFVRTHSCSEGKNLKLYCCCSFARRGVGQAVHSSSIGFDHSTAP